MRIAFVLCIFLVAASCKKSKDQQSETTLPGKWKIVKNWGSPGDGSIFVNDVSLRNFFLNIHADGKLESNYEYLESFSSYAKGENNSLKLAGDNMNATIWYSFNKDTLKLSLLCTEGCGLHLVRANSDK